MMIVGPIVESIPIPIPWMTTVAGPGFSLFRYRLGWLVGKRCGIFSEVSNQDSGDQTNGVTEPQVPSVLILPSEEESADEDRCNERQESSEVDSTANGVQQLLLEVLDIGSSVGSHGPDGKNGADDTGRCDPEWERDQSTDIL